MTCISYRNPEHSGSCIKAVFVSLWPRGEDPECGGAERAPGADGGQHQGALGGAGAAAGPPRRAGLRQGGEEQLHLGAHRRAEPTEGAPRAAEEEEED